MNWIAASYIALAFALVALLLPWASLRRVGYLLGAWAAALLLLIAAGIALAGAPAADLSLHLSILPALGFALDPIHGFFLGIVAVVYAASIAFITFEAGEYTPGRGRALLALTTMLYGAMVAILLAATVLSFIFTWEIMSLALWALVSFDTHKPDRVRAGLVTLALSEAGALAALAGLLILADAAGSTNLAAIGAAAPHLSPGVIWAGFLLTFFGFGVKTGIVPVNIWMGDGYAAAPRSLTPLFSGATLNLGVFSLWLIDGPLAAHALWPALTILAVGALTALLGIVYALVARDITRLLTHSSIENLGIVVAALGAGFAFAALDKPVPAGIALVAGLYHMLNHSVFKTLLFLGAGGIRTTVGSDEMDRLGGLMKRIPGFATLFLIGALAIAALPPFNGFVSEWLTLESLLRVVEVESIPVRMIFALSGALLALTAGLALTCFIMLAGTSLLGVPRSVEVAAVRRMPASVTAPMAVLAVVCLGLGVLVTVVIPVLSGLVAPLAGADPTAALVPAFFHSAPQLPTAIVTDLAPIGTEVGAGVLPGRGLAVLHSGGTATPVVFAMSTALSFVVIALILIDLFTNAREDIHMNDDERSEITVYLIRHGQTKLNAAGRLRGRTEAELDATGLAQADALGQLFQGVALARVIASPLRRTCQTAIPVARAAGVQLETDDGFNDRDYGDWTGEPKQEVEARFGSVGDAPGVETWQALTDRVDAAFLQVTEDVPAGGALAVIAHDAVNTALLQRLGLIAGNGPDPQAQSTGCWNKLVGHADHWRLVVFNALPGDENQP